MNKKSKFHRLIIVLLLLASLTLYAAPAFNNSVSSSLTNIDSRLTALDGEVATLNMAIGQFRSDSSRAAEELARNATNYRARTKDLENQVNQKNNEITGLKSQRDKTRSDSLAQAATFQQKINAIQKENLLNRARISALNSELSDLTRRRDLLLSTDPASSDNKAIASMQAEVERTDGLIASKQGEIADLTRKIEALHQDSIREENKQVDARMQLAASGKKIDDAIAVSNLVLQDLVNRMSKAQQSGTENQAQQKEKLLGIIRQKEMIDGQISQIKTAITAIIGQSERLKQSASAELKRLEATRGPLVSAAASTDAEYKRINADKEALSMLREKVRIDSAISKTRNEMNKNIELAAVGNKAANKIVTQKERELNALMSKQDEYIRNKPLVLQKDQQIGAMPVEQKKQIIEEQLATLTRQTVSVADARDKAAAALIAFDQSNPGGGNSTRQQIADFESQSAAKQSELSVLLSRRDSLDRQVQSGYSAVNNGSAESKSEVTRIETELLAKKKEINDLYVQRSQFRSDSTNSELASLGSVVRIKSDIDRLNFQISSAQRELGGLQAVKEKLNQTIVNTQNRSQQSSSNAILQRKQLDDAIVSKQSEIAQTSAQSEKLNQNLVLANNEFAQTSQRLSQQIASIDNQLTSKDHERQLAANDRDVIYRERAGTDRSATERVASASAAIIDASNKIRLKKAESAQLKAQREQVMVRMRQDASRIEGMISAVNQEVVAATARRDKALQDSITAYNSSGEVLYKTMEKVRQNESSLNAVQQQLAVLSMQLDKVRDDSVTLALGGGSYGSSFNNMIAQLDNDIAQKEREIAELKAKREKVRQDISNEQRRQAGQLIEAHQAIVAAKNQVDSKKTEIAAILNARARISADSAAMAGSGRSALSMATAEVQRQRAQLDALIQKLGALQAEKDAAMGNLSLQGSSSNVPQYKTASSSAINSEQSAQKVAEQIYTLLGDNLVDEASEKFESNRGDLLKYLGDEPFSTLQATVDELTGGKKKKRR